MRVERLASDHPGRGVFLYRTGYTDVDGKTLKKVGFSRRQVLMTRKVASMMRRIAASWFSIPLFLVSLSITGQAQESDPMRTADSPDHLRYVYISDADTDATAAAVRGP